MDLAVWTGSDSPTSLTATTENPYSRPFSRSPTSNDVDDVVPQRVLNYAVNYGSIIALLQIALSHLIVYPRPGTFLLSAVFLSKYFFNRHKISISALNASPKLLIKNYSFELKDE